jgi:membrane fusion protein, copper/silver efflux system
MSNGGSKRTILMAAAFLAVLAGAAAVALMYHGGGEKAPAPAAAKKSTRYHCPMHPTMISDKPGDCPICGMRMVPMEETEAAGTGVSTAKKVLYRSTMNPSEVSDHPGKDSMGMEMVPVEIEQPPPGAGPGVPGRVAVKVSDQKRQLIGVRTAPVVRGPLIRAIRAVGRVTYDETRLHHVHTKVGGWVERLYADATGEMVRAGQPLLTIYSPELLASGQEFLLALKARDRLAGTTLASIRGSGEDLVESARRRLLLFDLTPDQIEAMAKAGEAPRTVTLKAPISGHILQRNVTQGEKIESGTNLLDIGDLSRVWVLADVYEYELPFVKEGQPATMTLSYLPGRSFEGRITLINPVLSETTRTVKIRLEFSNPDFALKPEMFASVEIRSDLGEALLVPASAVTSTGERDIAFVDRGDGYFEPRELKLGVRLPDSFQVLEGLAEGEMVLVSGNFLVDSESSMKAALGEAETRR